MARFAIYRLNHRLNHHLYHRLNCGLHREAVFYCGAPFKIQLRNKS